MMISPKGRPLVGYLLVLLGALGFSGKSILIKLAYQADSQVDAISLLALRMLMAVPFFIIVGAWQNRHTPSSRLSGRDWLIVLVLGLTGYYAASYLDFLGLQSISAGLERVILFIYPTFVVVFSAVIYKRKIRSQELWALLLSYAGMILVFIEHLALPAKGLWSGSALVLASAVIFAGFTMGSGVMTRRIGSTRFTAYTMTIASIATLTQYFASHGFRLTGFSVAVYKLVFLMAIFSTVLPAFFMNAGIRRIGASTAAIISTTGPISTLLLAYFILGEAITPWQLAGTLLVLAGVYAIGKTKN